MVRRTLDRLLAVLTVGTGLTFLWGPVLLVLGLVGCASFARVASDIPATSTPERTRRYYQTKDVPYFMVGVATDEALRQLGHVKPLSFFRGPYRCGEWGNYCHKGAPLFRVGASVGLFLLHRETSPDYRESGVLFAVGGTWVWEVIRCFASADCGPRHRDRRR